MCFLFKLLIITLFFSYLYFLPPEMFCFQVSPETISFEPSTEHKASRWYFDYTGNYPPRKAF